MSLGWGWSFRRAFREPSFVRTFALSDERRNVLPHRATVEAPYSAFSGTVSPSLAEMSRPCCGPRKEAFTGILIGGAKLLGVMLDDTAGAVETYRVLNNRVVNSKSSFHRKIVGLRQSH